MMRAAHLWSIEEMLILHAKSFVDLMAGIDGFKHFEGIAQGANDPLPMEAKKNIESSAVGIAEQCNGLELSVSARIAESLADCKATGELVYALAHLKKTIHIELEGRKFYGPLTRYAKYFEQPKLFGDAVFAAFPSANEDIYEAGTCLAFERATACVMHLMRAVEVALKTLAATVGVVQQNDWGAYIREIDKNLTDKAKAAGKRTPDEQFYSEAAISFDNVKRAWRNPSLHVEKSYSAERAEEILTALKSFMAHLSTKIHE